MQIHLICCDVWHTLPIGRRSLSHVIWDIEHALPIGKHSLTRVGRHCRSHLYWECMHQSTEMKSWVPRFSEISADGCISAVAFNAVFGELICSVEVTGTNASNVKAWHETAGVEDGWTFSARDWTQHDNPPNGQIVEKGMRADEKHRWLAERKCAVWGLVRPSSGSMSVVIEYTKPWGLVRPSSRSISVVLEYTKPRLLRTSVLEERRNPLESRLIGVGICHWFGNCRKQQLGYWSLHQYLALLRNVPIVCCD